MRPGETWVSFSKKVSVRRNICANLEGDGSPHRPQATFGPAHLVRVSFQPTLSSLSLF